LRSLLSNSFFDECLLQINDLDYWIEKLKLNTFNII